MSNYDPGNCSADFLKDCYARHLLRQPLEYRRRILKKMPVHQQTDMQNRLTAEWEKRKRGEKAA